MTSLDEEDKQDLEEFLQVYRTAKRMGIFFVWMLGIVLSIAGILAAVKQINQP